MVEALLHDAGFTLTEVTDGQRCCGSAGTYSVLQPQLAGQLLRAKVAALEGGAPDVIATANIGCLVHIAQRHRAAGASLGGAAGGETAPMADQWGERMPRSVGLLQTIAVSVGVAIGSGIFRVPATVAAQLHAPGPMLLCWVLGGVIALCGALTVAELAGALPRSGGIFAYLLEGYGPLPAFLFGWTELVVIRAAALGAIATIFAEYLGYFVPLQPAQVRYTAALAIVLIGAINYIGVQRAAAVLSATTALKYAVLLALGLLAFTRHRRQQRAFHPGLAGRRAAVAARHRADPGAVDLRRLGRPGLDGGARSAIRSATCRSR